VATAHVSTHSIGAAQYALQAVYRAPEPVAVQRERKWQIKRLIELTNGPLRLTEVNHIFR
jgi:hypothetical protein